MSISSFWRTLILSVSLASGAAPVWGATSAYWRHDEGPAGAFIPDGPDTVLDASGAGNHQQTFSSAQAPFTTATYTTDVSPVALRSGLANQFSLDFGANPTPGPEDGGGLNDDNFTLNKPLDSQVFTALSVEMAFNANSVGTIYQALLGKDGRPTASPVQPFSMKIRGDDFPDLVPNQLFVEWIDGDGDVHFLATRESVATSAWNHVAFTLTATDAQLWVADTTGAYLLKDSLSGQDFASDAGAVLFDAAGTWTVGRGMFNGVIGDWSDAKIDEVRISDTALDPAAFLFGAASGPNPGDFSGDGKVDGADLTLLLNNWGAAVPPAPSGWNGAAPTAAAVDADELTRLLNNWGFGTGAVAATGVPEPASWLLASLGLVVVAMRRR